MDLGDRDKFGLEKSSGDPLNYHSPNMSLDWRFGSANLTNTSMGLVPAENSNAVCKGDIMGSSACSSVSMVDTFCPTLWDHPNSQNLGFCNTNVHASTSTSNTVGIRKAVPGSSRTGIDRALEMGWNPPNSMSKGSVFLQTGAGILPQSLSHFPADSAFIERAARLSCFGGGNFSDMVNPFGISEFLSPYSRGGVIQGPPEFFSGNGLKPVAGTQSQKNESNMAEVTIEGSPIRNERESGGFIRPSDEAKQVAGLSSNESDEAEFSDGGGQEEPSMLANAGGEPSSAKGLGSKKRKRSGQDTEFDQVKGSMQLPGEDANDSTEIKQKGDQNLTSVTTKPTGKHGKHSSPTSDAPKEDYIHVRARRGQATNSHSLAERVRREKISERMKFLQDLVPGCSKVTGKAVMLDEIITYVQSLQQQVEFLSMKLATVNPRLDFNIEGLLAKDILQSRGVISSTMGFSPDMSMAHPPLHQSQQGLIQAGIPGMGKPSDAHRRTINSQFTAMNGGYKEPTTQIPNMWDNELHTVVQMNFADSAPFNSQELNGKKIIYFTIEISLMKKSRRSYGNIKVLFAFAASMPPGHMKVEP
ncbi:hypothetical protein HHK36_024389 [Tetracentron sinense]|uniref:BHLH domain-containing protein n=1 Tax=Tetracentron sinense TaxID=13715 RepID=A0A834YPP8_TETSI|nr:hypothetical protein HHK36_024389 [Tetracentron sinense]